MYASNFGVILPLRISTDNTGNAVKSLALVISAFHGVNFSEIHPLRYPAFSTISKRRRFYKSLANAKFPAVDTEPTVFHRLFFLRETLNLPFYCRQNPVIMFTHEFRRHLLYLFVKDL